jgi:hypothetical protein
LSDVRRGRVYIPRHRWLAALIEAGHEPEIIELAAVPVEHWADAEQFWIGYLRFIGCDLLNATAGGDGLCSYRHRTETRERQRQAALRRYQKDGERQRTGEAVRKGYERPEARQNLKASRPFVTEETRAKLSRSLKKTLNTPEHRARMSAMSKGRVWTIESRAKLSASRKGQKRSAESCAKQSARLLGHRHAQATKDKISASSQSTLKKKRQAGLVGQKLTEAQVFEIRRRRKAGETVKAIASDFGIDKSTVSHICMGNIWKWTTEAAC